MASPCSVARECPINTTYLLFLIRETEPDKLPPGPDVIPAWLPVRPFFNKMDILCNIQYPPLMTGWNHRGIPASDCKVNLRGSPETVSICWNDWS